jgi:hypothetical protein
MAQTTRKDRAMTMARINKTVESHELIHTQPVTVMRQGAMCSSCIVGLPYGIQAYPFLTEWVCKSCAHYMHEHGNCGVCEEEVNSMEIEFSDSTVIIRSKTMTTVVDESANLMDEIRKIEAIESIPAQRQE